MKPIRGSVAERLLDIRDPDELAVDGPSGGGDATTGAQLRGREPVLVDDRRRRFAAEAQLRSQDEADEPSHLWPRARAKPRRRTSGYVSGGDRNIGHTGDRRQQQQQSSRRSFGEPSDSDGDNDDYGCQRTRVPATRSTTGVRRQPDDSEGDSICDRPSQNQY